MKWILPTFQLKKKYPARILLKCYFLFAVFVFIPNHSSHGFDDGPEDESTEEIKRLTAIWRSWESSVSSLELRGFRFVIVFDQKESTFDHNDLEEFIQNQIDPFVKNGSITLKNLQPITPPKGPSSRGGYWRPYSISISSGDVRIEDTIKGRIKTIVLKDGEEQVYREGEPQARIYESMSGYRATNISYFLFTPESIFQNKINWKYNCFDDVSCELKSDHFDLTFNKDTGVLNHFAMRLGGKYIQERFQTNVTISPQGIPVPRVNVYASYFDKSAPKVRLLDIFIFNQVEVNPNISPEQFQIAVPAGTEVMKRKSISHPPRSKGGEDPLRSRTTAPIPDIKSFSEEPGFGEKKKPKRIARPVEIESQNSSMALTLIVCNAILIIVILGIILFKRKTKI